ncbi:MAG TPA: triose-phosphate isomerase [Candidatus Dormibacteraeota bacterium]|nr:triose-phosphate isomerase [Candidatus Dormibacteraeota bacterium]
MAGNWKMHKTREETRTFFAAFLPLVSAAGHSQVVVAPPFTAIAAAVEATRGSSVSVGAQDLHWEPKGAFTGEISAGMLVEAGCRFVIIGHSERREHFGETDEIVARKLRAALDAGLGPIICVGESLAQREQGQTEAILERQFHGAFGALTASEFSSILVAYEPVWAIGTGRTATPELAAEAHEFLRHRAASRFGDAAAARLRILYGGSVKPDNIRGLMEQESIDGALVGGASLDAVSFAAIVNFSKE